MAKQTPVTPPPASLMVGPNQAVFAHLHGKSAHSDTVQAFWTAIKDLPGVEVYCSDPNNFGYVVACSNELVFAYAEGMQGVALRLPEKRLRPLVAEGAESRESIAPEWVFLKLFGTGAFEKRLAGLAREAYNHAALPSN